MIIDDNVIIINVNVFVHYPETLNCAVINDNFNKFFNSYFTDNQLCYSKYEGNSNVDVNAAPHNENQMIIIDLRFTHKIDESLNKYKMESNLKEFISKYFNNQIKDVNFNIKERI